jgi:glycogen(starch) synthase
MTRILHVLDHSIPLHSGYTFRTLSILREQRKLGWETFHLTSPKQLNCDVLEEDVEGWYFYRTPSPRGAGLLAQMRLTAKRLDEVVQCTKPDVIHAHSPVLNALPSLWVGRKRRLPVVYEMRASWEDAAVDHGTTTEGSLRDRVSRGLETFAMSRADHITTICEGLRRDISTRGIPSDRITVIPNAVDASLFNFGVAPDENLRASLGLNDATVLGFAGSFYGYEGLNLLLEAAARMVKKHSNLRVLLVGGGPQECALKAQAEALALADRVIFTGRVPHDQVQRYYELIDVLAYPRLPIRLTELVTPLKPLEAMAQGRMFVASDVGGHRELVRDGETGFLFKAGDAEALEAALERVLRQRELWPKILLQARRFIEVERTWAASVARYAEVYESVCSRYPRATTVHT